jgi:hypothetical protein
MRTAVLKIEGSCRSASGFRVSSIEEGAGPPMKTSGYRAHQGMRATSSGLRAFALTSLTFIVGCGASPSEPSPPFRDLPHASLAIEGHAIAFMSPPNYGNVYHYQARFLIHETRGLLGATILNVWPVSPDDAEGGYSYGPTCFGRTVHVAAGETLETFFSDEGLASLGCTPTAWSVNLAEQIQLQVKYRDDTGDGVVMAMLDVRGPGD